ncbi:hypothetical protein QL285_029337 [Trifolium repens]|jgi:hypothetical protein|nr:hypothetical protein QL285_029337 [Trifolium repens]
MTLGCYPKDCWKWGLDYFFCHIDGWGCFSWSIGQSEDLICGVYLSFAEGNWRWRPDPGVVFSVNSTYVLLANDLVVVDSLPSMEAVVFKNIW